MGAGSEPLTHGQRSVLALDLTLRERAVGGLLHDAVAAVLLIDVSANVVTYANTAAVRLAGQVLLPMTVDEWSAAAGLRDLGGEPLQDTANPLSRLATGQPVAGEPVKVLAGEAGGDPGGDGHLFWVTGFPLSDSPELSSLSLVILLELDENSARLIDPSTGDRVDVDEMIAMRERAVLATDLAFTITDPLQPDNPLVWVNDAFLRMTGRTFAEAVGHNCRFLQGPGTSPDTVREIREALGEQRSLTTTILNYRSDGSAFWNQLSMSPVFDAAGRLTNYVGVQVDVTARIVAEQERLEAYELERQARAALEAAHERLETLSNVTVRLTEAFSVEEAMQGLADAVVPALADWCMVDLATDDGVQHAAAAHADPERAFATAAIAQRTEDRLAETSLRRELLRTGKHFLVRSFDETVLERATTDPVLRQAFRDAGLGSAIIVPLTARERVLGSLTMVVGPSGRTYGEDDVAVAIELGRRAALCVDNVRLYEQEHRAAQLLQSSLLPRLPVVDGLQLAATYAASQVGARVGGDWYDVLPLPDGATGLVIGDVMGHDLTAAAAMGQFRGMLRALAWQGADPGTVLERLDEIVQGLTIGRLATVFYGRLEVGDGGPTLSYANAGHPSPLLMHPDGGTQELASARRPLLGARVGVRRVTARIGVPTGSTLALFTDGLVERRTTDLGAGVEQLVTALHSRRNALQLQAVADAVMGDLGDADDDVGLLLVRVQ